MANREHRKKLKSGFSELVLSETSVTSPWVESEVEAALERERRGNRLVLFPVRLDDAVIDTNVGWVSEIRRTRHIGDFRN